MGTIGIVMPVFNGARYIQSTLKSILASDLVPNELVVIDDGSTDSSGELARETLRSASFSWKVLSQSNQGEAAAVNEGVSRLQTDFVMIVNVDDPIEPNLLRETSEALERDVDKVVAYPDWRVIDENGLTLREVITQEYSQDLLYGSFVCIPGPGALIRRRSIRGQLRDPRLSHVADYRTWLNLGTTGDFVRVPKILASWRDHTQGQTAQGKGNLLANQYVDLMNNFFTEQPAGSQVLKHKASGVASAHYQAAIQGLFRPGVSVHAHLVKAVNIMASSNVPITRWPFKPVIVIATVFTPFSRWALKFYYKLRGSLN